MIEYITYVNIDLKPINVKEADFMLINDGDDVKLFEIPNSLPPPKEPN